MTLAVIAAFLRRIPWPVYASGVLALAFLWGRSHYIGVGEARCEAAHQAAAAQAGAKAAKAGANAARKADAATAEIQKETQDAAAEVNHIVRTIPRACPDVELPPRVQDIGRAAVERANRAL